MSTKFRLTTMEEDFKAFGLIRESMTETREETDINEDDDVVDEDEDEDEEEGVEEALRLKRRPKKSAAVRKALKRARVKYYKSHKGVEKKRSRKYAKSARGKKRSKMRAAFWGKRKGSQGKPGMRLAGLDKVANMVEEVAGIISTIGERQDREMIKGFANIALIADTIAKGFQSMGEDIEEPEMVKLGESFAEMAEDAATIAEGLDAQEIEIDEEVEAAFKADMEDLLDGLEVYADLTDIAESTDDDEDEDDLEEDEDDTDDDDEGN